MASRAFTEQQAQLIRQRLADGETTNALAKEYQVSTVTIRSVRRGHYVSNPGKPGPKARPVSERIWESIDRRGNDECWPWVGASRNQQSYPTIGVGADKSAVAARVLFELEHRPLKPKEMVLHTCRNSLCMNPKHLYAGSKDDWAAQLRRAELSEDEREIRRWHINERARKRYQADPIKYQRTVAEAQTKRKLAAIALKGGKCERCPEDHPGALQFHHRNPKLKSFGISTKVLASARKYPWDMIEAEVAKCDLLCANCHAKEHSVLVPVDGEWIVQLDKHQVREVIGDAR